MLIGIDANEANNQNRVGIGQYAYNILKNIYLLDKENLYIIYLKNTPLDDLPKQTKNWQYKVIGPNKFWTKFALPINLFFQKPIPNLFLSLSHYLPHLAPCPTVPFIMDLGYLKYPDQFTKKDLYQLTAWTKSSINKAKYIFTISQFTKQEIVKTYKIDPKKIFIAPPASDPSITQKVNDEKILQKYHIKKPYFLYLGTLKPSKNIPLLLKSFKDFTIKFPTYQLVIAGKKGWLFLDIFKTVKDLKLEDKIVFTDYFQDNHKWSFYRQSEALITPSFYEGFGMPALEAISVGTPVIGSNTTSIPEVVGQAGILIDPYNQNQLTQAMIKITNPKTKLKLIKLGLVQAKKFSWKSSAQAIINSYKLIN